MVMVKGRNAIVMSMGMFFMAYAVTLSHSRYPMAIALILWLISPIYIWRKSRVCPPSLAIFIQAGICVIAVVGYLYVPGISRFDEDDGGRFSKTKLAVSLATEDGLSMLIGAPLSTITSAVSSDGFAISDNSFLEISIAMGILFSFVYFFIIFNCFSFKVSRGFLPVFFTLYVAGALALTNSIYWVQWLMMVAATLAILRRPSYEAYLNYKLERKIVNVVQ
jgi:hypothetical protein